MGPTRVELVTSSLSEKRSNQLSYDPIYILCCLFGISEKRRLFKKQKSSFCRVFHPAENFLFLAFGCESSGAFLIRKEVIQPHLPVRLPCYDFTPLTRRTLGTAPLAVGQATLGTSDSDGVTGGVYKARERIHRAMLMRDY